MLSILSAIALVYIWTLGVGIPTLILISLVQGAADLIRDWRRDGFQAARPLMSRSRA